MSEAQARRYDPIAVSSESTVVAEYVADASAASSYQSEADLERELIRTLESQAYEYLPITSEADLVANLRTQLESLNAIAFSDAEWDRFFSQCIVGAKDGITEKTIRVQEDHVQLLKRDDGTTKNVTLLDKAHIHNNRLQVINQYANSQGESGAAHANRYDVTILVNGLPMVHLDGMCMPSWGLRAGASLTEIRGLPSRGCLLGLSDSCGRPRCLPSVRVLGSTCMHDQLLQQRSMASRASCSRPG